MKEFIAVGSTWLLTGVVCLAWSLRTLLVCGYDCSLLPAWAPMQASATLGVLLGLMLLAACAVLVAGRTMLWLIRLP